MRTLTLFSGGGLFEAMLKDKLHLVGAVEYDAKIAAVYRQNHGDHIRVASVCDVDYREYGYVDYIHASPACKEYSQAKTNGAERGIDIETAQATARAIETLTPSYVTIENVRGYLDSEAYNIIIGKLRELGYYLDIAIVNAADWGVPQTRIRLIVRASRVRRPHALMPTHSKVPTMFTEEWQGWHGAIKDLLSSLPDDTFAPWQLARMPATLKETVLAFGLEQTVRDVTLRTANEPAPTVTANTSRRPSTTPRALLFNGDNAGRPITIRGDSEPSFTIRASQGKQAARAYTNGRIVRITPRCLARFQTVPDDYQLPPSNTLATTIIGNGVPSLLARQMVLSFIPV